MEDNNPYIEKYFAYLDAFFWRAFEKNPFQTLCTILRVSGIQDSDWDPFEACIQAIDDFNKLLHKAQQEDNEKLTIRIAVLMYCHFVEMTAPHEILANLVRIHSGKLYSFKPFGHLIRPQKKKHRSIPPSAKNKFADIRTKAAAIGETQLVQHINSFFNDDVRNAFAHSDYVITDKHFRWTESGIPQQLEFHELKNYLNACFGFYSALILGYRHWLKALGKIPKYHKWPNFEVFELLTKDDSVIGFNVHFSNGSKATYCRTNNGVDCCNIRLDKSGGLELFIGLYDALKPMWVIDGKPVRIWEGNVPVF